MDHIHGDEFCTMAAGDERTHHSNEIENFQLPTTIIVNKECSLEMSEEKHPASAKRSASEQPSAATDSTEDAFDKLGIILSQPEAIAFHSCTAKGIELFEDMIERQAQANDECPIASSPERWKLSDSQAQMIVALCQRSNPATRERVEAALLGILGTSIAWAEHRGGVFVALAHQGMFLTAVRALLAEKREHDRFLGTGIEGMADFLRFQHHRISNDELKSARELIKKTLDELTANQMIAEGQGWWRRVLALGKSFGQIRKIEFDRAKGELLEGNENFEVNRDKQTLTSELERMGFPKVLCKWLEDVESEYRKPTSAFQFKKCADGNRMFFEELLKEMVRKTDGNPGEPKAVREFLKQKQVISGPLCEFIAKFYGYLSAESTHNLSATAEVARIARNMNIELGLLLLGNLKRVQG